MKLTIVLVTLIALGLSENSGGKKDEDISDPKFKQMIEEIESFSDPNDYQIKTVESEEMKESDEVVSGMKYYITLQNGGGSCEVDIWEQPWNNLRQVTKNTCPGGSNKRQMMAGGWGPVSDMTETGFQTALKAVLDKVNNMDNGLYRLVQSRMIDARQQVVAGMNYNITMEVGPSTCLKSAWTAANAQNCGFDATSGMTPTIVKAIVFVQSWTNTIDVKQMAMSAAPESDVSVESDANESDSDSNSESSENLLGSDNTDVLSHGETNDITVDENKIDSNLDNKKPDLHKILLGQDGHDYKIHGSVVDNGKANKKPDSYRYGNMMDGYGGPDMMGDYKVDKGQYNADDMMGGYRGGNMMDGYRGGNMMDGYRGGNMMDDYRGGNMMDGYRGGNMMDDYRGGDMMGGYGGYMMGGYQRRRLMGGYRRGHMMGGYRRGGMMGDNWRGGMMGDNWRRGMMGGYRGGDMMRDYKDDKNVEDKFWGGHMMDPRLMGEYMSRNGMGDPEQMAEFMSKNGMGDPKQMAEFMSKNGMGNYEQMAEFMSKNGMGDPKQMAEFMSKNGMMGDYFLGGDKHDYESHGGSSSDEDSASEDTKPVIGGDKHDYLPHKGLLGGDSHDYKSHDDSSSDEDGSSKGSKPLIGGGKHDYLPHGDTEVTCTKKMFEDFQTKFSKKYMAEEETAKRFAIFCENMKLVESLQRTEEGTARYGATKFADLTEEEFKQYVGKPWNKVKKHNTGMKRADIPKGSIPTSFDWREHGAVTPVKNQGSCGSCWAFSTTGNIEGQWAIKRKQLISLSEQELVDCDKLDEGCNGGLPSNAYKEIERLGGLETETEYKYKGEDEKCEFIKKDVKVYINDSVTISSNETEMAAWLAVNGPISIGINAFAMQFYMGGISHPWKIFCNPKELDHGVLIVGYGVHEGEPYWMVKNSWGPDWGEKGYYLVYRGAGVCGLNTMCTSAVVD